MREFLLKNKALNSFISFGSNLVFNQASTYTGILLLKKDSNSSFSYYEAPTMPVSELQSHLATLKEQNFASYRVDSLDAKPWTLGSASLQVLLQKLYQQPTTIGDTFESVFQGIVTGADDLYFLKKLSDDDGSADILEVFSQRERRNVKIERAAVKPMLKGDDVSRYSKPLFDHYCIYPYKLVQGKTSILEEEELSSKFPLAYAYLEQYRSELKDLRIKYKTNPRYWYSCHRGRSIAAFESDRIITAEISLGCNMTLDSENLYHNTTVYSLMPPASSVKREYWLGLLNSQLMWWFLKNTGNVLRGGYFRFKTNYLNPFPIPTIDFSDSEDVARYDKMVQLVNRMLALYEQLTAAKISQEKTIIQRQIEATDRQIDQLVYELYGLNDEEIRIVEEAYG